MINTHLKFEAKIPNGSKVVTFTRNYTKFLSLKANLTLKIKVKVTSFRTRPGPLCDKYMVFYKSVKIFHKPIKCETVLIIT